MAKKFGGRAEASLAEYRSSLGRACDELPGIVVVHGDNEFLRLEAVRELQRAWLEKHAGGDVVVLRGAGETKPLGYGDLTAELSGNSLFARDKLVVVRQAERLLFPAATAGGDAEGGGSRQAREKRFVEFMENLSGSMTLLFECAQFPKNRTMAKALSAVAPLLPCPPLHPGETAAWLRGRAESLGKRLDPEAAELLMTAHGGDLGALASELDKLSLFVADAGDIDAAAVGEFMTGSVEFDIFGLTNAVEARNPASALSFARKIAVLGSRDQKGKKDDGERSAHRALSLLAGTAQNLLRAGAAGHEGMSAAAFAAADKLSPWRAERLLASARKFTLRELRFMAGLAADGVKRAHDTGGDAKFLLEWLAVRLASGGGAGSA